MGHAAMKQVLSSAEELRKGRLPKISTEAEDLKLFLCGEKIKFNMSYPRVVDEAIEKYLANFNRFSAAKFDKSDIINVAVAEFLLSNNYIPGKPIPPASKVTPRRPKPAGLTVKIATSAMLFPEVKKFLTYYGENEGRNKVNVLVEAVRIFLKKNGCPVNRAPSQ